MFEFAGHTLDVARRELRRGSVLVAVEPQVFDLLVHLVRNRERVVSKDDLIAEVWDGRIVSDSTLTSRINAARKALGDSGEQQRFIRTFPRKGFRFVSSVREKAEAADTAPLANVLVPDRSTGQPNSVNDRAPLQGTRPHRASIAVMPFADAGGATGGHGGLADALAHDVITRLAKLRMLFVIAQGTMFSLQERGMTPQEAARTLNVDYVATGSVRRTGSRLTVTVELIDADTARIVWADSFERNVDDALLILTEIGDAIVASIAVEIEAAERSRAILKPPNSLDAWEAHHRGLWHMYRFNKADNATAQRFFAMAISLDPTFSRAYAGLSFTHWQNAFQGWAERRGEIEQAYAAAGQSVMADDRDPAAHWAMGRALWLRGLRDQSIAELDLAVDLSPNFAHAHYSLAFVQAQAGDPAAAIASAERSRRLSPFDPMLFAIYGTRAMALVRLGRLEEAADVAVQAAARPNAHAQILGIAAYTLALAGRIKEARAYLARIHQTLPGYGVEDFLLAMRFESEGEAIFRRAEQLISK